MTLRVVGAGLGRTGTHSLKLALEQLLGGPCYHMLEVLGRPDQAAAWSGAARGEGPEWTTFLAGYVATVDWPAASFWREMLASAPEAVVVLSVPTQRRGGRVRPKPSLPSWIAVGRALWALMRTYSEPMCRPPSLRSPADAGNRCRPAFAVLLPPVSHAGNQQSQQLAPDPFLPRARRERTFREWKLRQPARAAARHPQPQAAGARPLPGR